MQYGVRLSQMGKLLTFRLNNVLKQTDYTLYKVTLLHKQPGPSSLRCKPLQSIAIFHGWAWRHPWKMVYSGSNCEDCAVSFFSGVLWSNVLFWVVPRQSLQVYHSQLLSFIRLLPFLSLSRSQGRRRLSRLLVGGGRGTLDKSPVCRRATTAVNCSQPNTCLLFRSTSSGHLFCCLFSSFMGFCHVRHY